MKRFGILLLLTGLALGQTAWLLSPSALAARQDVEIADDAATQTASAAVVQTEQAAAIQTAAAGAIQTEQAAAVQTANAAVVQTAEAGVVQTEQAAVSQTAAAAVVQTEQAAANQTAAAAVVQTEQAAASQTAASGAAKTAIASITPSATLAPTYKNIHPGDTVRINTGTVNVRAGTSTSTSVRTQVSRNQTFVVLEGPIRANGYDWIRINMGTPPSDPRWIAAQYVVLVVVPPSPTPANSATPTSSPTITSTPTVTSTPDGSATATSTPSGPVVAGAYNPGDKIVIRTAVNVRKGAGTSFDILMVAQPGEQGTVETGNTPGGSYTWIKAKFGNVSGWLAINYLQHQTLTTPTPAPGAWLLSLSLDCYSSPERITLVNSASSSVIIQSIRTHYDAGSDEPFVLNQTLSAKQTRSYLMGSGASGSFALTSSFRLTNNAGTAEGVTVETSFGAISRSCPASSSGERWVEVDLSEQYMTVWQGSVRVSGTYVSTGKAGFTTPRGTFRVLSKYVSKRMTGCANGECWDTPNVPYSQFFTNGGHALHGAYWHNDFGSIRSHGCVNLPVPFSEWLYYWLPFGARVVVKA